MKPTFELYKALRTLAYKHNLFGAGKQVYHLLSIAEEKGRTDLSIAITSTLGRHFVLDRSAFLKAFFNTYLEDAVQALDQEIKESLNQKETTDAHFIQKEG